MNNRILAALFALALALFIGVAPVEAEAAHVHVDTNNDYVCDDMGCSEHVHHIVEKKAVEPTCTVNGRKAYYYCGGCKNLFTDADGKNQVWSTDLVIPKTGHNYEWSFTDDTHKKVCTNPNCTDTGTGTHSLVYKDNGDGTHTVSCEKDECKFTKVVDHVDGTVGKKDCKCDACEAELEHTPGDWLVWSNPDYHFKACTACGKTVELEKHVFAYSGNEDHLSHSKECTDCHLVVETESCVDTETVDHVCDLCGNTLLHYYNQSYMGAVIHKAPTCEEDGLWLHKQCTVCGLLLKANGTILTEETKVNPATGHDLKWNANYDEHWQYCVREGCTYTTEKVAHDADAYTSNGNHTHTLNCKTCGGYAANVACSDSNNDCKCDYCGAAMAHNPGADTSKFTRIDEKAATCESAGNLAYYKCNVCGGAYIYDGTPIDPVKEALGHKWQYNGYLGDKHLVQCVNPGCTKRDVMPCEDTNGDCHCDLPVLSDTSKCGKLVHSHKFIHVDRVEPTCGKEGTEEYLMYEGCGKMFDMNEQPIESPKVLPALEHEWSEDWEAVEGGHTKTCVNCGETQEVQPHVFANGNPHCTLCGAEEELEYHEGKEATCTEPGFKEYWKSQVTDRKYSDAAGTQYIVDVEEIPALGHQFDTSEGEKHVCAVCGEKEDHVADPENPCFCKICYHLMPGHEMAYVPTVPATCTEDGTKAYFRCSCGKLYDASSLETAGAEIEKPAIIPAIGHKLSGNLVEDTRLGDHYRYCVHAGCDYEIHSEHDCKAEDPLSGNYHQFVCECGYTRSEIHYDKDGDKKCDECGHDMANTTVTVEQHDSIKVITGDKDKVDNTQSWWKNWWNMLTSSNAGSQTSGNTPAASTTTSGSAAPAESGEKTAATGGSTGAGTGTQSEKPSTGTGSQNITQKPGTETGTQNPGSAPAQNSFRDILFQVWNWLNGLFASK